MTSQQILGKSNFFQEGGPNCANLCDNIAEDESTFFDCAHEVVNVNYPSTLDFENCIVDENNSEFPQVVKVEEKFGEQNFRVFSEMRFLGKIKVAILDFVG